LKVVIFFIQVFPFSIIQLTVQKCNQMYFCHF